MNPKSVRTGILLDLFLWLVIYLVLLLAVKSEAIECSETCIKACKIDGVVYVQGYETTKLECGDSRAIDNGTTIFDGCYVYKNN